MDIYQEQAQGIVPAHKVAAEEAAQHKITSIAAIVLLILCVALDIISLFEIPIADILAWIIEVPIILYLYYVGASQYRQLAANVIAWLAELIPLVDLLPLYTIGILIVILIDRNETLARVASKIPNTKSATGQLTTGGGKVGSRLARNSMFGAASESRIHEVENIMKNRSEFANRLPGKLRSMPPNRTGSDIDVPVPQGSRIRSTPAAQNAPQPNTLSNPGAFPDTYYQLGRENNPDLVDILTDDIDITGSKTAERAAAIRAGTPNAPKKVQ